MHHCVTRTSTAACEQAAYLFDMPQVYPPQDVQTRLSAGLDQHGSAGLLQHGSGVLAQHGSGGFEPDSGGARSGGGDSGGRSGNDELTEVLLDLLHLAVHLLYRITSVHLYAEQD